MNKVGMKYSTKDELAAFKDLIKSNVVSKDDIETLAILAWANRGEEAAKKISPDAITNLRERGWVSKNGKLYFNPNGKNSGIEFGLLVCGAKGFIQRVKK